MTLVTRYPLVDGRACLDPAPIREAFERYGSFINIDGLVNSIECPRGRAAGNAWFLMSRANADAVSKNAAVTLAWRAEATETFSNYWLVKALAVTPGLGTDQAYLVHFRDVRAVLEMSAANVRYNFEKPLPFALADSRLQEKFFSDSLNAGALHTWATAFADLWSLLPGAAGSAPTLPVTPSNGPRNLSYNGQSAWGAICEFLARIGCEIGFNPRTGALTVIDMNAYNDGTLNGLADYRAFDAFPLTGINAATKPANIAVQFPRVTPFAGPDEATEDYSVATGISGAASGTESPIWDPRPANFCPDASLNNGTDLDARADELAGYLAGWYANGGYDRLIVYNGIRRLQPTSRISRIVWRDWGDGDGAMTAVYNGGSSPPVQPAELPVAPKIVRFKLTEELEPGDSAAADVLEWVDGSSDWQAGDCTLTVWDSVELLGEALAVDAEGFAYWHNDSEKWELLSVSPTAAGTLIRCKVYDDVIATNSTGSVQPWDEGTATYLSGGDMLTVTTLVGHQPLFKNEIILVQRNADENKYQVVNLPVRVYKCRTQGAIAKGSTGSVRRYDSSDVIVAYNITARSTLFDIAIDKLCHIAWSGNQWEIISAESGSGGCIRVLTRVTFNEQTCELTWCDREICLPAGSSISEEDCGGPAAALDNDGARLEVVNPGSQNPQQSTQVVLSGIGAARNFRVS